MAHNPEMAQFEALGIVDVGEAETNRIGSLNLERVKTLYELAVSIGIIEAGAVDLYRIATHQFVDAGHGLDIKARLTTS